jgi:hypothetical protein
MPAPVAYRILFAVAGAIAVSAVHAQTSDLIVSGTTYQDVGQAATISAGSLLAPASAGGANTVATADGQYQNVFLNAGPDAAFGVTSQVFLQNYSTNAQLNIDPGAVVGSFSSKSELAINLSSDGTSLTFMAYNPTVSYSSSGAKGVAAVTTGGSNNLGLLDISNSNTPGFIDPTNGVNGQAYRSVAQINVAALVNAAAGTTANLSTGSALQITNTNAYSGNNGRAVVDIGGQYYMVGNAGNSGKTGTVPYTLLAQNTGIQTIAAGAASANSTVVGACTQNGTGGPSTGYQCGYNNPTPDKSGKDNNYRGLAVLNGNLYTAKGSGSNGVNTLYQASGIGTPSTATVAPATGFPGAASSIASNATPFGIWFANSTTMYVAYEGGDSTATASGTLASEGGLAKYTLGSSGWTLDYFINAGLNNSSGYAFKGSGVGADATGSNSSTTFYTDGLRNLAGQVNANGTVSLYAVTSTVTDSTAGTKWDQGANPDQVVTLTDNLAATTLPNGEAFSALETSAEGTVYRGVALAPVPLPAPLLLLLSGMGALLGVRRRYA